MVDHWPNARSGVVVGGIRDPYKGKPGGDFVWEYGTIYKIPDQWYEDQRHPPKEELAKLTKSQRYKLGEHFSAGNNLSFYATDDGSNIITHARKGNSYLSGRMDLDTFLLDRLCVVSNEVPRRCFVEGLGFVPISEELAQSVLPNVGFSCRVALEVETNYDDPGVTFENCTATVNTYLHSLIEVTVDTPHFVWDTPWNRNVGWPRNVVVDDGDLLRQDELDRIQMRRADERAPLQAIRKVPALMMGENELYSSLANGRPVRMAMDLQKLPGIGHVRTIYAYWCRLNQAYVVYNSRKAGKLEVRKRAGRAGEIDTFKVRVKSVGIGGYYENEFLGTVYDKDYLLRFVPEAHVPDIDVWVRYWAHNAHAKFVIDAIEVDKHMELKRIIRDQTPFAGHGLVMSVRGDVYIKELAQARCRLLSYFLGKFDVGQWIALRARPMPSRNGYWVVSAQRFPPRRLVEFPTLDTAPTPNGKLALHATGLTKWPKNDFMFYSPLMGLVEADTSAFADFIRFIHPAEVPQTVDLWVVENENPLAQTRFKAYSVKAPGPIVQVLASGADSLDDADYTENMDGQSELAPADQPLAQRRAQLPLQQPQRVHTPLPVAIRDVSENIYVHWMRRLSRSVMPLDDNADADRRH